MNENILIFLVILLSAAVLIVPFTARLGLGAVIGYLLAGVLLGPQGLGLMSNPEAILHLSEFGVVLLLFLIGLELHPERLWAMRRIILGMGALQIGMTTLAIGGGLMAIGWSWSESLIAGLALSMSSTAIAMQIIREKGLKTHPAGRSGFAVLLFQDLAFIPILLLVGFMSVNAQATDTATMLKQVGISLGAVTGIVLAVRYLSYPFFRWVSGARVRELSIAFSLLIVLSIAYVMEHVGLSMGLGTFIAGVILADSEYRHEVEANIEPFKGLLLGLFFLAVGMSIKLDLIVERPLAIAFFLMALLALKILALIITAVIFKTDKRHIPIFALLLSQGGEFAFVLFGQAIADGSMAPERVALLNAVVTLSMLTTPLLVLLYYKFFTKQVALEKPDADHIDDEGHPVIIAGFGRVAQIITRVLNLNRIPSVVIDNDPEQVERVRKFGFKAYYGDAAQMSLLEAAGIGRARLLIITISNQEVIDSLISEVKRTYPDLQILCRARDRIHAYKLMDRGVDYIERETFGSALSMAQRAMQVVGFTAFHAHRTILRFRRYDLDSMERLYGSHRNEKEFISQSREAVAAIENLFQEDRVTLGKRVDTEDWG